MKSWLFSLPKVVKAASLFPVYILCMYVCFKIKTDHFTSFSKFHLYSCKLANCFIFKLFLSQPLKHRVLIVQDCTKTDRQSIKVVGDWQVKSH